ncbi:MAG TPA: hypothetical protein VIU61_28145 [Kofleriaceae bacterium]
MKTIALCVLLVACGKKAEDAPKAQPEKAPDPVGVEPDAAVAVIQAITSDAPAADAAVPRAEPVPTRTVTVTLVRDAPARPVKVTLEVPTGWKQTSLSREVVFHPASDKSTAPTIRVGVYLDRRDPATMDRTIEDEIARRKVDVAADDQLEVVRTRDRPDGKLLTRRIDARKTRKAVYFETICIATGPGQPFAVEVVGTAREDDALIATYEDACSAMTIVDP